MDNFARARRDHVPGRYACWSAAGGIRLDTRALSAAASAPDALDRPVRLPVIAPLPGEVMDLD